MLKRARVSGSKAQELLKTNPEAYQKGLYKGYVYVRYPKDSTGALDTAKQVLQTQIDDFSNFAKHNIPIHQETNLAKYLREQQRLKPYFSKLASEEAKIVPYFYGGQEPNYFSGFFNKGFTSATMDRLRSLGQVPSGPTYMLTGLPMPSMNNQYSGSPYKTTSMFDNKYPIYATGFTGQPDNYGYATGTPSGQQQVYVTGGEAPINQYGNYPTGETPSAPSYYGDTPPESAFTFATAPTITYSNKEEAKKIRKQSDQKDTVLAYQTVYYTDEGKEIKGNMYPNRTEATAEGFDNVDQTALNKFNIKKVIVRREMLKRHLGTSAGHKFKSKNGMYIEKVPYRKDTKGEGKGGFNIMPYVFSR